MNHEEELKNDLKNEITELIYLEQLCLLALEKYKETIRMRQDCKIRIKDIEAMIVKSRLKEY